MVEGIEAQTRVTLDNIEKVCQAAGGKLADVYEIRMILKEREHSPIVSDILKERIPNKGFIAHGYKGELLHPDMELELEASGLSGPVGGVAGAWATNIIRRPRQEHFHHVGRRRHRFRLRVRIPDFDIIDVHVRDDPKRGELLRHTPSWTGKDRGELSHLEHL